MGAEFFAPSSSPWNSPLPASPPVHASNAAFRTDLQRMLTAAGLSNSGWYINYDAFGAPIYRVRNTQARVPVTLVSSGTGLPYATTPAGLDYTDLAAVSAAGVPIPSGAQPSAGTDKHLVVVNEDTSEVWEYFNAEKDGRLPGWSAEWGAYIPNHRVHLGVQEKPYASWGATGTSLPLTAGTILISELAAGVIPHALQLVLPDPLNTFVWPANRSDGYAGKLIPEGTMVRWTGDPETLSAANVKATATLRAIARALKTYGAIVNDKSTPGNAVCFRAEYRPGMPQIDQYFGDYPNNFLAGLVPNDFEFIASSYRPSVIARTPVPSTGREVVGQRG